MGWLVFEHLLAILERSTIEDLFDWTKKPAQPLHLDDYWTGRHHFERLENCLNSRPTMMHGVRIGS